MTVVNQSVFQATKVYTRGATFAGKQPYLDRPRIVASFDVLDPAHYTLGTPPNIATVISQKGLTVTGANSNTLLRPDLEDAAIGGEDAMKFTAGEFFLIGGMTTTFSNVSGMFRRGPVLLETLPAVDYCLDIIFSNTGNGLIYIGIRASGAYRIVVRRYAADTAKVFDTKLKITTGVQHETAVAIDFKRGKITLKQDEDIETFLTGPWTSGYGLTSPLAASVGPQIGRSGSTLFAGMLGRVEWGIGIATPAYLEALRAADQVLFALPQRTLMADEVPILSQNRIYRKNGSGTNITLSGRVVRGSDAAIEIRLLDMVTLTPATGWETPIALTTSSGLVWSGIVSTNDIPIGNWFKEYRKAGERDVDAVIDRSHFIGIAGSVTMEIGNSILQKHATEATSPYPQTVFPAKDDDLRDRRWSMGFEDEAGKIRGGYFYLQQTVSANQNVPVGTGEPFLPQIYFNTGGLGIKMFGNLMRALEGGPQLCVCLGYGGTGYPDWQTNAVAYNNAVTGLTSEHSPGYDWDRLSIGLGTVDINNGTSESATRALIESTVQIWRDLSTDGDALRCYLVPPGWLEFGPTTTPNFQAGIKAAWTFLDDFEADVTDGTGRVWLAWSDHDFIRSDGAHPRIYFNGRARRRYAQNIAFREYGASHGARGPKAVSITALDGNSYFDVNFELDGGSTLKGLIYNPADPNTLTPAFQTTGLTGSLSKINGSLITPSSVVIQSALVVRVGTPAPLVAGQTIDFGLYIEHNFSQAVMLMDDTNPQGDNIGVPARPTNLWLTGTVV